MVAVLTQQGEHIWYAVGVYGWPEIENENRTWRMMKELRSYSEKPMIFFGDLMKSSCITKGAVGEVKPRCEDSGKQ